MASSDKVNALVEQLNNVAKEINNDTDFSASLNAEQRTLLVEASREVTNSVKGQLDAFTDQWSSMCEATATRLFMKWKAFEAIPLEGSITFKELADKLNADVSLISTSTIAYDEKMSSC